MAAAVLVAGDLAAAYASLALVLLLRMGAGRFASAWSAHVFPFTLLFVVWAAVFFANDLYDRSGLYLRGFVPAVLRAFAVNTALAIALFYFAGPFFGITPKTNLLLFLVLFFLLFVAWRRGFAFARSAARRPEPLCFVGPDERHRRLVDLYGSGGTGPYVTYGEYPGDAGDLETLIGAALDEHGSCTVVRCAPGRDGARIVSRSGVSVIDAAELWEGSFGETPLSLIDGASFLAEHRRRNVATDRVGRIVDIAGSAALMLGLSWLMALAALAVRLASPGPALFRQRRCGRDGRCFTLYKFRTMYRDAGDRPVWTQRRDARVTPVGRVLRRTHIDELPQLWNVFCGDMSFFGPRPERPDVVETLAADVPLFPLRHLVKPGLTGWAQVNYGYADSPESAAKKLAYDLYYVKHRSPLLDLKIVLRTVGLLAKGQGR